MDARLVLGTLFVAIGVLYVLKPRWAFRARAFSTKKFFDISMHAGERTQLAFRIVGVLLMAVGALVVLTTPLPTKTTCELPMDYAVRSNCPFTTATINGTCAVVCYEVPQGGTPFAEGVTCTRDADCTCTYNTQDIERCTCINNKCAAVVNSSV